MIAVTSLTPFHINFNSQLNAIDSWIALGFKVISVNHPYDINLLQKTGFPVEFVPTIDTMESKYGKPYVKINTLIDEGLKRDDRIMLINSDIELLNIPEMMSELHRLEKGDNFIFGSRHDYKFNKEMSMMHPRGIDFFILNRNLASLITKQNYCMGKPVWDYWLPYTMYINKKKLHHIKSRFAMHQVHKQQWLQDEWEENTKMFLAEFKMPFLSYKDLSAKTYYAFTKRVNII